jgi:hypothetical protein
MPPNPPLRQHYLPVVFLKQFSEDGPQSTRDSFICRVDATRCVRVPVESQGYQDGFYSRRSPFEAEAMFKDLEGKYGAVAQKIWRQENSDKESFFALIVMMFDLHLRGLGYENASLDSNASAYLRRAQSFFDQVLIADGRSDHSVAEAAAHLEAHWRVRVLSIPSDHSVITSDWPSLWFMPPQGENVCAAMLAVTPNCYAVAFDQRHIGVAGSTLTQEDTALLNRHQLHHAVEAVFTPHWPSDAEIAGAQAVLANHEAPGGPDDGVSWPMNLLRLPNKRPFNFLTVTGIDN